MREPRVGRNGRHFPFDDAKPSGENFERLLLHSANSSAKNQVVVLIDEYDAPVNGFIDDPVKLTAFRDVMHQFSLVLKANVKNIDDSRPVWLVGCNYNPKKRGLDKPRIVRFEPAAARGGSD